MGEYQSDKNFTSGPRSTMASSSRFDPFLDTGAFSAVRLESGFSLIFRLVLHWLFYVTLPFNGSCPTPALSASGLRESCLAKKHTGMRK
ncbi:unnamed protein product [Arabidopsis halleri]